MNEGVLFCFVVVVVQGAPRQQDVHQRLQICNRLEFEKCTDPMKAAKVVHVHRIPRDAPNLSFQLILNDVGLQLGWVGTKMRSTSASHQLPPFRPPTSAKPCFTSSFSRPHTSKAPAPTMQELSPMPEPSTSTRSVGCTNPRSRPRSATPPWQRLKRDRRWERSKRKEKPHSWDGCRIDIMLKRCTRILQVFLFNSQCPSHPYVKS